MCALSIAASFLAGGALWLWSLHGGSLQGAAALEPRTAARIFGWLCLASIVASGFFLRRRTTAFDRRSAAPAAALLTTLFTGAAVLYLSYFAWPAAITAAVAREPSAPAPVARPSLPATTPETVKPHKTHLAVKTPSSANKAATSGPCAGTKGLGQYQCRRCGTETGFFGFICQENARGEYCSGRDGSEPGCPWARSAAAN